MDDVLRRACEVVEEVGIRRSAARSARVPGTSSGCSPGSRAECPPGRRAHLARVRGCAEAPGRRLGARHHPVRVPDHGQFLPVPGAGSPPGVLVDPDPDGPDTQVSGLAGWAEGRAWAFARPAGDGARGRPRRIARIATEWPSRPWMGGFRSSRIPLAYDLTARPVDARQSSRIASSGSGASSTPRTSTPSSVSHATSSLPSRPGSRTPRSTSSAPTRPPRSWPWRTRRSPYGGRPHVRPAPRGCRGAGLPVRLGGGMRVKVLEGLSAGMAIVAHAARPRRARPAEHVWVAETDQEFEEALVELLTDPVARTALGRLRATGPSGTWTWMHGCERTRGCTRRCSPLECTRGRRRMARPAPAATGVRFAGAHGRIGPGAPPRGSGRSRRQQVRREEPQLRVRVSRRTRQRRGQHPRRRCRRPGQPRGGRRDAMRS